ncbi:MAG: universal stress protein [Proteobacteria bacterium]|nr:universal stress protein [Pseudomonadota bacterium]
MLSKVLIATDLSGTSYNMVQSLKELKKFNVSNLILTHVIDLKYSAIVPTELKDESLMLLNKEAEILTNEGFNVTVDLRVGTCWKEILDSAKDNKASMVIIGSHGKSIAKEIVLGSVTSELIENANLPVLVLKMSDFDTEKKARFTSIKISHLFDNVLFATDFSSETGGAKKFLKDNKNFIKELTIAYVQEPIILEQPIEFDITELDAIALKRLEDIEKEIEITSKRELLHGLPSLEITDLINNGNFSLVVMGTRGLGLASRLLLGSTSRYVIRHSKTPILIVPQTK